MMRAKRWHVRPSKGSNKKPYSVKTGSSEGWNLPENQASFNVVMEHWADNCERIEGLSFVVKPHTDVETPVFVCLDFDAAIENGKPFAWIKEIIDRAGSYVELSRSGGGLHLFLYVESTAFVGMGQNLITSVFSANIIVSLADKIIASFVALAILEALPPILTSHLAIVKAPRMQLVAWIAGGIVVAVILALIAAAVQAGAA